MADPRSLPVRTAYAFVTVTFLLSWSLWGVGMALASRPLRLDDPAFVPLLVAGSFGPTLAAIAVVAWTGGVAGLRDLMGRLVRVRVAAVAYLVAFFVVPATFVVVLLAVGLRPDPALPLLAVVATMVLAAPVNAVFNAIGGVGPLGEELGWRGLLLPALVHRYRDGVAAVIVGLVWAVWHWPLALFADWRVAESLALFLVVYPIGLVALSLVITRVWRWSRGSVLLAVLLHAVVNGTAGAVAPGGLWAVDGLSTDQIFVLVNGVFWVAALVVEILGRTVLRHRTVATPRDAYALPRARAAWHTLASR
jgi:membrane protease YdiL (CAAX protease family)